jgi:hypothetical protein
VSGGTLLATASSLITSVSASTAAPLPRCRKAIHVGTRRTPCLRPVWVFVQNPPGDPESADGRLARLSRQPLLALGGLDPLARGGLEDLLIE